MADSSKNIGIKVSQIGYDVNTAGDANLYFSSSWPILKIEKTDTVPANSASGTIKHDLTYPPFALVWNQTDGLQPCISKPDSIVLPSLLTGPSRYFIFRLPINVPYQSPVVRGPVTNAGTPDHDFGIKFAKKDKDLESDDFRDYTIHSSARSPLLHACLYDRLVAISGQGGLSLRWVPDLPYNPIYFAYYSADGITFTPLSTISQVPPKVIVSPTGQLTVTSVNAGYGSIILLKDPLDSTNRRGITL